MELLVVVTLRSTGDNREALRTLFQSSFFIYHEVEGQQDEYESICSIMRFWENTYPTLPCLIVDATSISWLDSEQLSDYIDSALHYIDFDLIYLCHWQDECHKYRRVPGAPEWLRLSISPTATQAIIYRASKRTQIVTDVCSRDRSIPYGEQLNKVIASGQLTAAVTIPNLIDFDINRAISDSDFSRVNSCQCPATPIRANYSLHIWLALLIVVLAILITAILWYRR